MSRPFSIYKITRLPGGDYEYRGYKVNHPGGLHSRCWVVGIETFGTLREALTCTDHYQFFEHSRPG